MNAHELGWDDLEYILAVCQSASLSGAARKLEVNHSTVFRRINKIEEKLGVRLFERLSSGYAMTEAGEAVLQVGERIENEVLGLSHRLIGKDLRLSGDLTLSAPDALAIKLLMPIITEFSKIYPDICIDLLISNDYVNIARREADIAVRATRSPPESLIGRRVCSMATTIYRKALTSKDNLVSIKKNDAWLMPDDELAHLPVTKWQRRYYPNNPIVLQSNSFLALYEATKLGQGIVPLPCFVADPDPLLQRCLAPPDDLSSEIWVLTHPDLRKTARIRAFTDFLVPALKKQTSLLEGSAFD